MGNLCTQSIPEAEVIEEEVEEEVKVETFAMRERQRIQKHIEEKKMKLNELIKARIKGEIQKCVNPEIEIEMHHWVGISWAGVYNKKEMLSVLRSILKDLGYQNGTIVNHFNGPTFTISINLIELSPT